MTDTELNSLDLSNPLDCIQKLTHEHIHDGDEAELSFVLENGKAFRPAILPVNVQHGPIGDCFANSAKLAYRNPHLAYVEGISRHYEHKAFKSFGTGCYVPFMHAWCVDIVGNVVDPTWGSMGAVEYFGVAFKTEFLFKFTQMNGRWTLIHRDWLHLITGVPKSAWSNSVLG